MTSGCLVGWLENPSKNIRRGDGAPNEENAITLKRIDKEKQPFLRGVQNLKKRHEGLGDPERC